MGYRDNAGNEWGSQDEANYQTAVNQSEGVGAGKGSVYTGPGGGKGGGGAGDILAGGFLMIIIIGPVIAALIIGFVWALLLKIPNIGKVNISKILTTVAMLFVGPMLMMVSIMFGSDAINKYFPLGALGSDALIFGSALLITAWYFCWHYDVVKEMGAWTFANCVKTYAKFIWFGFLGVALVGFIAGWDGALAGLVCLGVTVAAIIAYVKATRPYARIVRERNKNLNKAWKPIVMLAALGLTVLITVGNEVERKAEKAAEISYFAKGNEVIVNKNGTGNEGIRLYQEPSQNSNKLDSIPGGTRLTIIDSSTDSYGNPVIQVNYNGTKGWITSFYSVMPVTGTATLLEDVTIHSGKITIKKGETVTIGRLEKLGLAGGGDHYEVMDSNGNFSYRSGGIPVKKLKINK